MKKKLLLIITIVFFVALLALVIYWNPPSTPFSVSFDAIKINNAGKQLDTVPVELKMEWHNPWFEDARLEITSADIDGFYTGLKSLSYTTDRFPGRVPEQWLNEPFLMCRAEVFRSSRNEFEISDVLFSPDYERWLIAFPCRNTFYIGSVNEADTPEGLYEYFKAFILKSKPL